MTDTEIRTRISAGEDSRTQFINRHRALFWYIPEDKKSEISDDLLVETILNEGSLDDYRELKCILSPQHTAKVFFSASGRKQNNYYPEIRHFFSLLLKEYA